MTALVILILAILAVPVIIELMRKPMNDRARADAPGSFATLSQGITHYQWIGPMRGPVAVCVHGLTTPSFVWQGLAAGLARMGYRVLIYDLYGRGYSDRVTGRQTKAFFLRQLDDLLANQQVDSDITLVGYSMGGAIATAFAADHPDRIRHLVLLAPAGMGTGTGAKGLAGFIIRTPVIGNWLMLALFARQHRKSTEAERDLPGSVENIVDLQQNELRYRGFIPAVLLSLRGILSRPQMDEHKAIHRAGIPVLAIWGDCDKVIPLSSLGTLTQWSRHARQDTIQGAGHGLPYTHTDEVLRSLTNALRDGLN